MMAGYLTQAALTASWQTEQPTVSRTHDLPQEGSERNSNYIGQQEVQALDLWMLEY
jgi:hypothetical protein